MNMDKDDDELLVALLEASSKSNSKKKTTKWFLSDRVIRYGLAVLVLVTLVFWGVTLKDAAQADDRDLSSLLYNEELLDSMDPTFAAQIREQQAENEKSWFEKMMHKKKPKPPPVQTFAIDSVFGDNMVLQHGTKAAVYGFLGMQGCTSVKVDVVNAETNKEVFTTTKAMINTTQQPFGPEWGVRPCAKADCPPNDMDAFNPWNEPLPTWKVLLPPQQPGGNFTITATCTSDQQGDDAVTNQTISSVTFGDMWYCSGQSNMQLPLKHAFHKNQTAKALLKGQYSNIRLMVGNSIHHPHGDDDWSTSGYGSAGGTNPWMQAVDAVNATELSESRLFGFGAACWYFAQALVDQGVTVPIGLANTAIGGRRIQEFMNNATINQCLNRTKPGPQSEDPAVNQLWLESQLYATQVLPFADMTVKGWIWYQGENNMWEVKGNSAAHMGYSCEMKLMIEQWRALWSKTPGTTPPDAPFGVVTLASGGSEGGPDMGTMHMAQTANYGVLPNVDMPNTFLAQAYDLDDEWGPDLGACFQNECCEDGDKIHYDPEKCNDTRLHDLCNQPTGACAAHNGTPQMMGGIHPRSKKYVGDRLGFAAFNLLYGGKEAYTGPTIQGCSVLKDNDAVLEIRFNKTLLMGDKLAEPVIPPIIHRPVRHHPPAGGSWLFVQTNASMYCMESHIYYDHEGTGKQRDPYHFVCPEWAGGTKEQATNPITSPYDDGWINVNFTLVPGTTNAIHVDLTPLGGAIPTAVRYAWGQVNCCDYSDPNLYVTHNCIATCPLQAVKSKLPANPFSTRIVDGHCKCAAPQVCTDDGYDDSGTIPSAGAWE